MLRAAGRCIERRVARVPLRKLTNVTVGVPAEITAGESRVAMIPDNVKTLVKKGAKVQIEKGAGRAAGFQDAQYEAAGAAIVSTKDIWKSNIVVKICTPTEEEAKQLENRHLIAQVMARQNPAIIDQLAKQGASVLAFDMLLRTLSRGQAFDVLSSQANIAGYRSVVEAAATIQRPFAGSMTPAGRVNPAKVIVVGAGVAGLAAIQQAKNMNANVFGFDVRSAAKEQVEAMKAKFLEVSFEEDGSADGGYAKEMSKEWFDAAEKMLLKEMADTDVVITTALIPGRPAPTLITKAMVAAMPPGSVTVDLASEAGGNVETTVPGEVVEVDGVTCIGHKNFPARMANMASQMFGGNATKLLISMDKGPDDWNYRIDLEDTAVRSMCVVNAGTKMDPYVPPPPAPKTEAEIAAEEPPPPPDLQKEAQQDVTRYAGVGIASLGVGSTVPDAGMLSTFALSVWVGQGAVQGVAHALHSPLMSITNAISGMTIVGGMLQLGGGMFPTTVAQSLATTAVSLSAVNLVGGFVVTGKMLDMFRRPDDPPEYWNYYMVPPAVVSVGYAGLQLSGGSPSGLTAAMGLASGLGCVGGISAMSNQESSRLAPALAMSGVGLGLTATAFTMDASPDTYAQLAWASALGGGVGFGLSGMIGPTQLPQAVAGFHSFVGIAATSTAVADFLLHDFSHLDGFHCSSIYMGAWMGAITTTGSIIACGKLAEVMDSKPMALAGRDQMNMAMAGTSAAALAGFVTTKDPMIAGTCLATGTTMSGLLGFHMTASIGGADMPVVITLLNSYSGWALCAEGFILNQPVLTIVGSLIGSSGAFLTKIMCDGMNRSLSNVILGGFGAQAGAVQTTEGLVHTEIQADGVAEALLSSDKVCIVPGYGLAVAQAQGTVASIATELKARNTEIFFAVHPVAGRMPGQLNVLLAEAGVPYDQVYEMEEVNEIMNDMDVTMVVGANDTVNSAAETDPNCDIAGMPVIQVWNSKQVVFFKRSMASGYAGVDNPVFYNENTDMCLGNAADTCVDILDGVRKG